MEARVAKLEANIEHLRGDVLELKRDARDIRDRMRTVEVKIDHLPGKGFIVTALIMALTVIAALNVYSAKIQSLLPVVSP